jgi:hypothetical protein
MWFELAGHKIPHVIFFALFAFIFAKELMHFAVVSSLVETVSMGTEKG